MLTIQEVGTEILGHTPRSLYIFVGPEYGIKKKYISIMKEHYGEMKECSTMSEIIQLMSTKHFVPLKPMLYVVRYDDEFVSSLSEPAAHKLLSLKIAGTVVCIYDSEKQATKLDKFLPNNTVRIDNVNTAFKIKYLHSDFPHLPDKLINLAAEYGSDYNEAQNICTSMSQVAPEDLFVLSDQKILALFGKYSECTEAEIKVGVASKNFSHLMRLAESYPGEVDNILYTILSTLLELDKIFTNTYAQSDLREYVKRWTAADIYNMFMQTYNAIKQLRSYATDAKSTLIYILSLLKFSPVPSVEFMEED